MISILALAGLAAVGSDSTDIYNGRRGELLVPVERESDVDVRIDARLDEAVWQRAPVLTGFTVYEPIEGSPAPDDTEVRVFYTDDAIYFGIRAYDSQPDRIRATLAERDRSAFDDDWIRLMLREIPIFAEGTLSFEVQVAPTIRLWPTDRLALDLSITRSRIERTRDDSF